MNVANLARVLKLRDKIKDTVMLSSSLWAYDDGTVKVIYSAWLNSTKKHYPEETAEEALDCAELACEQS